MEPLLVLWDSRKWIAHKQSIKIVFYFDYVKKKSEPNDIKHPYFIYKVDRISL